MAQVHERERTLPPIASIGKLPPELLVEIFGHAAHTPLFHDTPILPYAPYESIFARVVRAALPKFLRLSQVSPYWRQIVHNTPQLWTEGVVEVKLDRENKADDPYMRGLKDLLARSSPFPISVSLAEETSVASAPLGRIVLSTAQRWRNLNLNLVPFSHFKALDPGTFEALERLHIRTRLHETEPLSVFQHSPLLRHFSMQESYDSPSYLNLFQLPWSQLTRLRIGDQSLGGCRKILLQCSNLVSAYFATSHHWDFGEAAVQSPVVALPFLTTLTIVLFGGLDPADETGGIEAFFLPLALPSLQTLELAFNPETDDYWPNDIFSQFQSRSPNIEEINLLFCQIDSEGFLALLRDAPALTTLYVQNCWNCIVDDIFAALRYDGGDSSAGPLVPKLQNIYIEAVGDDFEESLFEDAIRSRWWTDERPPPGVSPPRVARLKKVSYLGAEAGWNDLSVEFKARMKELEGQGLDLNLY